MTLRRLRSPAQVAINDYRTRTDAAQRLDALVLAFETLCRVDALVLASALLGSGECRDDKVRAYLLGNKLGLGHWVDLLQALAVQLPAGLMMPIRAWVRRVVSPCSKDRPGTALAGCRANPIDTLKSLRNRRSHDEARTREDVVRNMLATAECCLARCLDDHPPLGTFISHGADVVTYELEGVSQRCDPLVMPGALAGEPDNVLLYRGASRKLVEYATIDGATFADAEARVELVRRLGTPGSLSERLGSAATDAQIAGRLVECSEQSVRRGLELRRYRPEIAVPRAEADAALEAFLATERRLFLLVGPPGAGKTTFACALAAARLERREAVLLLAADRFGQSRFPSCVADVAGLDGDIAGALERASVRSPDEMTLLVIDDLGATGDAAEAFSTLLAWAERLPIESPLRIVATARTERLRAHFGSDQDAASPRCFCHALAPLYASELTQLAALVSAQPGVDPEVGAARREAAARLGGMDSAALRRPGVAVPLLEGVQRGVGNVPFSVPEVYGRLLRGAVLDVGGDGSPRAPGRGLLVRRTAAALLRAGTTVLAIDDPQLQGLLDGSGRRTVPYEELLSMHVLVEALDDAFAPCVSFADARFFEFVAALTVDLGSLPDLLDGGRPAGLDIATFVVQRAASVSGADAVFGTIRALGTAGHTLLTRLASIDGERFMDLFGHLGREEPEAALGIVTHLVDSGESRLGDRSAQLLVAMGHPEGIEREARYLRARALFELDDYAASVAELGDPSLRQSPRARLLCGDIEVSREDFGSATNAYETVLTIEATDVQRAHALRGLGYSLGRLGRREEAQATLRTAIDALEPGGDSRQLAEALGDLGEILCDGSHTDEARTLLNRSLEINGRLGAVPGIGIVQGLLAEVDMAASDVQSAARRIDIAETIAHRTGNRWRQAWIVALRARLLRLAGDAAGATATERLARSLFEALGARPREHEAG